MTKDEALAQVSEVLAEVAATIPPEVQVAVACDDAFSLALLGMRDEAAGLLVQVVAGSFSLGGFEARVRARKVVVMTKAPDVHRAEIERALLQGIDRLVARARDLHQSRGGR